MAAVDNDHSDSGRDVLATELALIDIWIGKEVVPIHMTADEPAVISPPNKVSELLRLVMAKTVGGGIDPGLVAFLHQMLGTGVPTGQKSRHKE